VVCLAPRARKDRVRPRRLSDVVVRPLNFTVRPHREVPRMIRLPRLAFAAAGFVALAHLTACGFMGKAQAVDAAETFHRQLNEGKLDDIWNGAADGFRDDILRLSSKARYEATMEELHQRLGRAVASTTTKWTAKAAGSVTTVLLDQDTRFEHGTAVEHFTFVVTGGALRLREYAFTSPQYGTP